MSSLTQKTPVQIKDRLISAKHPPYIVAEMSANHNGSLDRAFEIIEQAALAGADAVKIQSYRPDTITLNSRKPEFMVNGGLWDGKSLYELYEWAHMPWEWHRPLFEKAHDLGITIFSSPFDFTAVDLLESLNAPAYKIASFELVDLPLIRYAAATGKPLILSTGMASQIEIAEAVEAAKDAGCEQLIVLHCVSGYPAPSSDYNLRTLPDIAERFGVHAGLSDHTIDNAAAVASVALGSCFIEKHFTLDRNAGGPDDSFSLEPKDLKSLCTDARKAWEALGEVNYDRKQSELGNLKFRRSLYVVKDIQQGERFTSDNVRSVRPAAGMAPKHYEAVLASTASQNIEAGTALKPEHLNTD